MRSFGLSNTSHGTPVNKTLWLLLTFSLLLAPVSGQRRPAPRRPAAEAPPQQAAISFDTLLAADSYKIYGEVRGVGELLRSEGVKDLVDPVVKLAGPPKEFRSLVKWLNAHADALMTSRLMFAAWPSRPKLPHTLVAIEFPSAEEAQKFEPQLREFLPKLLPTPKPESAPSPDQSPIEKLESKLNEKPAGPSYILKQAGPIVFVTDAPFSLKDLRPAYSKLLAEDQNFRTAHDRFNSESVFVYLDVAAIEKEEKERQQRAEEEQKRIETEAARQQSEAEMNESAPNEINQTPEEPQPDASPEIPEGNAVLAQDQTTVRTELVTQSSAEERKPNEAEAMNMALSSITNAFFGGRPKWPEGIGAAVVFEGDSYVVRVLLINGPDKEASLIPFFPQFASGPALVPESPSVLPADTELFVSASLDFPKVYEGMLKSAAAQFEQMQQYKLQSIKSAEPPSPFEAYERRLGIKIKDDLLPLLGHEVAFTIPVKAFDAGPQAQRSSNQPSENGKQKPEPEGPSPIFAIALKDREPLRALLPRMIDSIGFKGAGGLAQTEKRDDTELVNYANVLSYAFIGNFLVLSPDTKATRHVVDAYLNHETLSSSTHFRNYTRWQPRQVLGQVYVSPALMESYNSFARDATAQISDQFRDFLMLLSPVAQPVTFAISNEGLGPLHELHVPKNLVMLIIAGVSSGSTGALPSRNESVARSAMRNISSAEATYQATEGAGRYGTLDELIKAGLISKELTQGYGYRIELTVSNTRFEVSAVPTEYGKTGKLSFFLDDSAVLRSGDHAGGAATIADKSEQ